MSVMWPLVDFTEANGATCVVPGSHRLHARPEPERAISVSLRAGSALFYLGSLWHGGGANLTDRPRTGVVLNYAASWLGPSRRTSSPFPPPRPQVCPSGAGVARVQPAAAVYGLRRWCPPEEAASEPPRSAVARVPREERRVSAEVQGDGAELRTVGGSSSQPPTRWTAPSTSCTEGRRR